MAGPGLGNRGTHAAGYQVMGCNMSCGDKGIPREGRDSQGGMQDGWLQILSINIGSKFQKGQVTSPKCLVWGQIPRESCGKTSLKARSLTSKGL